MFDNEPATYPAALAAAREYGEAAMLSAIRWALEQQRKLGGKLLIYAPAKRNLNDHQLLSALARQPGVDTATWRTGLPSGGWSGIVLAAWPGREHLAQIAEKRGVRALSVVPWTPGETDAWAAARQPELLAGATPPGANALDPVIVQGLKTMTAMVNHANNLAGSLDKRDAVAVLQTLHKGGYVFDADAIYAWALANGWPARGADRLRDLAQRIGQGRTVQRGGPYPFKPGILQQWQRKADRE